MHSQRNIKICNAKQAKQIYQYKIVMNVLKICASSWSLAKVILRCMDSEKSKFVMQNKQNIYAKRTVINVLKICASSWSLAKDDCFLLCTLP